MVIKNSSPRSCSQYSIDAIHEYGSIRGIAMTTWRLVRCNPFSHGGVDYAVKNVSHNVSHSDFKNTNPKVSA